MFNKLKRKFVIINMCLLSIVFLSIFSAIYLLTANTAERQTSFALEQLISSPPRRAPENPTMASSILVDLDKEGKIIHTFSYMNIDSEIVSQAVAEATAINDSTGKIKIGDTYYAFLKQQKPQGTKLGFIDRTPQQRTLNNFLIIFVSVGSGSLVLLLFVSVFFANRAIAPIKETFEKQKQFIADASHELKTPLTVIRTNASLVLENENETVKSQAKWLEYIVSQTDKMSGLLESMLSLAKMDYSEQSVRFAEFDLSKTLTGALLSFEAVFFERKIRSEADIQPGIKLYGDRDGIKRLVDILIDNAAKNTEGNGSISVSLKNEKNKIEFKIRNTGRGIPPEHIEKIFERFYRVDSSRSSESGGQGLGLSIAKSIVEQHKGKIYARSNMGVDTTFIVELPQKQ